MEEQVPGSLRSGLARLVAVNGGSTPVLAARRELGHLSVRARGRAPRSFLDVFPCSRTCTVRGYSSVSSDVLITSKDSEFRVSHS